MLSFHCRIVILAWWVVGSVQLGATREGRHWNGAAPEDGLARGRGTRQAWHG